MVNPRKKFILVGTTANGGTVKGKTRIERYCRFNQDDPLLVKWTPIEVGEKQILYSLIKQWGEKSPLSFYLRFEPLVVLRNERNFDILAPCTIFTRNVCAI